MARTEKYTKKQMREAIKNSRGFLSNAARTLGCSVMTISNYMKRYDDLRETMNEVHEELLDFCENKLLLKIQNEDLGAIIFYLKCKGKNRGFIERPESMPSVLSSGTIEQVVVRVHETRQE